MVRFSCPKCQMVLQAEVRQAGATVACPQCKFQMQVPAAPPVAKVAPQSAATLLTAASTPPPWYFTRDGKKFGPYTAAQLKQYADSGQLLPTDLVWKEGMEGWKPASTVKGLFAAQQPPSQPAAQAQPSGSHGNPFESLAAPNTSPLTQAKNKWQGLSPRVKVGIIAGAVAVPLVLILLICGVIGLLTWGKSSQQGGTVAQKDGSTSGNKEAGKKGKVALPDFSKVDYKQGPKGEKLETREMKAQAGPPLLVQGFVDTKGNFIQHGRMYSKFPNGQLCQESFNFNDKMHGPSKMWFESGGRLAEEYYVDDKRHGPARLWNKDGKLLVDVTFDHGRYDREDQPRMAFVMILNGSNLPDKFVYTGNGTLEQIVETFGKPDHQRVAPGGVSRVHQLWTYRCADGSLTMWVGLSPGPKASVSEEGWEWSGKAKGTTVAINGEDNFPGTKTASSVASGISKVEFRKKVKDMAPKAVTSPKLLAADCNARTFFDTLGQPNESAPVKEGPNPYKYFIHRYTLRDGVMSLRIVQGSGESMWLEEK
jgi:hypothetical protein